MKRIFPVFIILLFVFSDRLAAQYSDTALLRPDVIRYAGKLYVFGYKYSDKELGFHVERLSPGLKKEKEFDLVFGKKNINDFYSFHIDTLHDYLNFVVQEADNDKTCRVVRLDKHLKQIADIEKAEIARVNTFTAYEKEFYYYKKDLYVVRPLSKDSAHKFVLQKYTLKDSSKVFEYVAGWQLNLAKQQYHRCKIIRVDDEFVYMFTNVLSGSKQGQWLQYIDTKTSEIVQSYRFNDENEGFTFLYGAHYFDPGTKQISIAGYKLPAKSVANDYSKIDFIIGKNKFAPVFVCTLDSAATLVEQKDNCVTVPPDIEREKEFKHYIFKINKFAYTNNQYIFLYEVIASANMTAFKTFGYAYSVLERDIETGALKPRPTVFNCTYRDSKNKMAKYMYNVHELDAKGNAEEILYRPAVSGVFKQFCWLPSYSGDKIFGVSAFTNKKETILYKYLFAENKWENVEITRGNPLALLAVFGFGVEEFVYFKNSAFDPEIKIIKGLEGNSIK